MRVNPSIIIFLAFACANARADVTGAASFTLIAAGNEVYRLNTVSGEIGRVMPDGVKSVQQDPYPLSIGSTLRLEDGTLIKYLGHGKFGPAITVSNW